MTDKLGIQLNIGDTVIFTTGGRGNTYLELGTIREIRGSEAIIYAHDSKRVLTNPRYSEALVSAMPIYTTPGAIYMIYYQFHNSNGHWFGTKAAESNVCYQAKFSHNSAIINDEYYGIQPDWTVATFTEAEFQQSFPELLL